MIMQGYNIIMLYDRDASHILMCRRRKDPYKGLINLIGGKIEPGEDGLDAAYREMYEESGAKRENVSLTHVMDFVYHFQECYVEAYAGRLKEAVEVKGDENELFWSDLERDFFDMNLYAGEGNIGHIIEQVKMHKDEILGKLP
ncbi:MAG: NUDIX domain-containing protein [Defluviitaleaceae bacterium]|nr:NUDIX domain-containing protein [Defluviitaleaceae bacterium]